VRRPAPRLRLASTFAASALPAGRLALVAILTMIKEALKSQESTIISH
jgi:hypothetical protein